MTSMLDSQLLALVLILALILVVSSVRVAPEFVRFAVYRQGRFRKVIGPGIFMIIPIVDRLVRFKLDESMPDWASMSFDQARQYVDQQVLQRRYPGKD